MNLATVKNVASTLVGLTVLFVGYYLYSQKDIVVEQGQISQELFNDVQKYIERREVLDQITLDTTILSNPRFTTLTGLPRNIPTQPVSRPNPFDEVGVTQTNPTE